MTSILIRFVGHPNHCSQGPVAPKPALVRRCAPQTPDKAVQEEETDRDSAESRCPVMSLPKCCVPRTQIAIPSVALQLWHHCPPPLPPQHGWGMPLLAAADSMRGAGPWRLYEIAVSNAGTGQRRDLAVRSVCVCRRCAVGVVPGAVMCWGQLGELAHCKPQDTDTLALW
jgi:hypothetical protein